jgi:sec-independent protein translocase protein TatA
MSLPAIPVGSLPVAWHPGTWELIIMLLIILVLFGSRLPKVARSLGQGISEFKKGVGEGGKSDPNAPAAEAGNPKDPPAA